MERLLIAGLPFLLALAGCGEKADHTTLSAEAPLSKDEVAKKLDSIKLAPGEWESTQEIIDAKMAGLPEGVSPDAITRMTGHRSTTKYCLSPEQAANPSAQFLSAQKNANCTNNRMIMTAGKVDAKMQCTVPQQSEAIMKISMEGTYLSDRYDIDMVVDTHSLANEASIIMKIKTTGKHIGNCTATDSSNKANGKLTG